MSVASLTRAWAHLVQECLLRNVRCLAARKGTPGLAELPQPPKKALSGYQMFTKDKWTFLEGQCKGSKDGQERVKLAAMEWRAADAETKQKYLQLAHEDAARYAKEYKNFISGLSAGELLAFKDTIARAKLARSERRLKTKLRKLEKPKGPKTAFNIFCLKMKTDNKPITENMKELGEAWRNMTTSEKQVYQEQAELDKRRYLKEMTDWEVHLEETGNAKVLSQLSTSRARASLYPRTRLKTGGRDVDDVEEQPH
ncbi:transcription factor A, mitochondrial [Ixodes scapularis]